MLITLQTVVEWFPTDRQETFTGTALKSTETAAGKTEKVPGCRLSEPTGVGGSMEVPKGWFDGLFLNNGKQEIYFTLSGDLS